MLIGEVARRAGVRASAIRYYERIGLLARPARRNGRRQYGADVIGRLRLIRFGKDLGFTLEELKSLSQSVAGPEASTGAWRRIGRRKAEQVREDIEHRARVLSRLEEVLLCQCKSLGSCATLRRVSVGGTLIDGGVS